MTPAPAVGELALAGLLLAAHLTIGLAIFDRQRQLALFNPALIEQGRAPMKMDSKAPSIPYRDYVQTETRFNMLWHTHPEIAEALVEEEQRFVNHRYHFYKQLSELDWSDQDAVAEAKARRAKPAAAEQEERHDG